MLSPRIPLSTVTVGTALARVARVVRFISVIADLDLLTPVTCAEPAVEDQLSRRPVLISFRCKTPAPFHPEPTPTICCGCWLVRHARSCMCRRSPGQSREPSRVLHRKLATLLTAVCGGPRACVSRPSICARRLGAHLPRRAPDAQGRVRM